MTMTSTTMTSTTGAGPAVPGPAGSAIGDAIGEGVSLSEVVDVVFGVDTHEDFHVAAAVASVTGAVLAQLVVEATVDGYAELVEFADEQAGLRAWAIEGTGSHGAGLTRYLEQTEELIVELDRPERAKRRGGAKTDAIDAVRAAREALARPRLGTPRAGGQRQALAVLLAGRRSAVAGAPDTERQVRSLLIAAPDKLRSRFAGLKLPAIIAAAARLRVPPAADEVTIVTLTVIRDLARRAQVLRAEAAKHEKDITRLVRSWRPDLLDQVGVGPIVAATVLCAWSHPGRIHSEAAFAKLAGVAPIPANSGKTTNRHRLNPYGDRRLNCALHTVALTRQRCHQPSRDYTERRTSQGKTPREIRRCLKRYIARELYRLLENPKTTLDKT
jgi:transposase